VVVGHWVELPTICLVFCLSISIKFVATGSIYVRVEFLSVMETFKLEIDLMQPLQVRLVECKLVLLALMWMQHDENQQSNIPVDYSSPLLVDNSEWRDRSFATPDVEHFRKVSNTARIGAWDEMILLRLSHYITPHVNCLYDASFYALVVIAMHLIDAELKGIFVNSSDQYFARRLVYESFEILDKHQFGDNLKFGDEIYFTGIEEKDSLKWGMLLNYLSFKLAALGEFIMGTSDIDDEVDNEYDDLDEIEREEFDRKYERLPADYFQCKPYIEKCTDRSELLSRLVQRVVYYLFVGKEYNASRLDEIMSIPVTIRSTVTFQSNLAIATYRIGYFITASGIEEWADGKNWFLCKAFSSLMPFYNRGKKDAAGL
jgi:hypothetical protein